MTGKEAEGGKWLVLVHQLPARPSNLRVRIWRRLQQLGAVALRNSVYVLPNSAEGREDFEWLRAEIAGLGGAASVMAANVVDAFSDDELVERFRQERAAEYRGLMMDAKKVLRRWRARRRGMAGPRARREAQAFRERYQRIRALDFFGSPDADLAADVVSQIEATVGGTVSVARAASPEAADRFRGKVWVTRAHPGVDRMASAWLIRKFVDSSARFAFIPADERVPPGQIAFDMYRAEFGHHGTSCTMEMLIERFGITDQAVSRLAQVVHDLDLKDQKFEHSECAAVGRVVEGLRQIYANDEELLAHGMVVMEALYRSFGSEPGPGKPISVRRSTRR